MIRPQKKVLSENLALKISFLIGYAAIDRTDAFAACVARRTGDLVIFRGADQILHIEGSPDEITKIAFAGDRLVAITRSTDQFYVYEMDGKSTPSLYLTSVAFLALWQQTKYNGREKLDEKTRKISYDLSS